jgi:predicted nucleic acid-binding protein
VATLIDTSLWVDFTRRKSPERLKRFVAPYLFDASAHLAEPVVFELLRDATEQEMTGLTQHFATFPVLETPDDLWQRAATLGRRCRKSGHTAGSIDLLITAVALAHDAMLVTLDEGLAKIGECGGLQVKLLRRPAG